MTRNDGLFLGTVAACVAVAALLLYGCSSAATRYQAALLLCVERAQTLAESKACRRQVDMQFGVTDAGDGR